MPWRSTAVQVTLDVFASEIVVERSTGETRHIALLPARTVADTFAELQSAFDALDVACAMSPTPQEIPDVTPLHEDRRPAAYDADAVRRWFAVMTASASVFDEWRAHFFGRTGIQLWWGALDLALLLFNGKHCPAPTDRGYLMKYDLDAEMLNVGFYGGDETTAPFFYGYLYPQPEAAPTLPMAPATASWSTAISEWTLPYDVVRAAPDPGAVVREFLDALYAIAIATGGWDRAALSYDAPKRTREV